jgi:hypothetical protein
MSAKGQKRTWLGTLATKATIPFLDLVQLAIEPVEARWVGYLR